MKRTETILVILSLLAISLNLLLVPGAVFLSLLSLGLLSALYLYFSFALFNNIRLRKIFKKESYRGVSALRIIGAIGTGLALSMLLSGILFKLMRWPGAGINLMAGLFLVMIVTLACLIRYAMNRSGYCRQVLLRTVLVAIAGIGFYAIPSGAIMRFKLRNHPAYREALERYQQHPDNPELQLRMEEERRKMDEGQ